MRTTSRFPDRAQPLSLLKIFKYISLMSTGFVLLGLLPQTGLSQEPVVAYSTLTSPGAGTKFGQGSFALSINDTGVIAGFYVNSGSYNDSTAVYHGFLRASAGAYITFDVPASGTKANQGTRPAAISGAGTTVGVVTNAKGVSTAS